MEALDNDPVTNTNFSVGQYLCSPFIQSVENMQVDPIVGVDALVTIDGAAESVKVRANAQAPVRDALTTVAGVSSGDHFKVDKLVSKNSSEVYLRGIAAGPYNHVFTRYNVTVRAPTIVDNLRLGMPLTAEEQQISNALFLEDNLAVGLIPRPRSLLGDVSDMFDKIEPYAFTLAAVAATSDTPIGYRLDVPSEQVWVLLGIGIETIGTNFTGVFSDTFIRVDRDGDPNLLVLDCSAMPNMSTVRCYVPFTQKLYIHLTSATGSGGATVPVWFIIGKRPATLVDHIRWGDKFRYRSIVEQQEAEALIKDYTSGAPQDNLIYKIKAGVI